MAKRNGSWEAAKRKKGEKKGGLPNRPISFLNTLVAGWRGTVSSKKSTYPRGTRGGTIKSVALNEKTGSKRKGGMREKHTTAPNAGQKGGNVQEKEKARCQQKTFTGARVTGFQFRNSTGGRK